MLSALEYFKEKNRMTKDCEIPCFNCPLSPYKTGCDERCGIFQMKYPEKAVEIVENWSKEHPVKTYLGDFLEKHPNARTNRNGTPIACLNNLYGVIVDCGTISCSDCWKQPLDEMEERHD